MAGKCILLKHVWPSSRRDDDNSLIFSLVEDYIDVTHCSLWDARDLHFDIVSLRIAPADFLKMVIALRDLNGADQIPIRIAGIKDPRTSILFTRMAANQEMVNITCTGDNMTVTEDVSFQKLLDAQVQLQVAS